MRGDQIQGHLLGRFANHVLERYLQGLAVGPFAGAVAVTVDQPHLIEQCYRPPRVEFGVGRGEFGLEVAARGHDGKLARHALAKVGDVVDFVAIDRQRHRTAETHVLKNLAQTPVGVVQIELQYHVRAVGPRPDIGRIGVFLLEALKQRDIGGHKLPSRKIDLAGRGLGRHDLRAIDPLHLQVVDIGQLIARGIYFGIIGVASQQRARRGAIDYDKGGQHRTSEVNEIGGAVDRAKIGAPVLQPPFCSLAFELLFGRKRRVVALHKMRRHRQARTVVRQVIDK